MADTPKTTDLTERTPTASEVSEAGLAAHEKQFQAGDTTLHAFQQHQGRLFLAWVDEAELEGRAP